jgi:hypothetical protein
VKWSDRWIVGSAIFITVRSRTTISCARAITPKISQRRRPRPLLAELASDIEPTVADHGVRGHRLIPVIGSPAAYQKAFRRFISFTVEVDGEQPKRHARPGTAIGVKLKNMERDPRVVLSFDAPRVAGAFLSEYAVLQARAAIEPGEAAWTCSIAWPTSMWPLRRSSLGQGVPAISCATRSSASAASAPGGRPPAELSPRR